VAAKELQEGRPVSNKKAWTVINNIEAIGKNVPLSNQQRQMMRRDAFGIIIWNGQPSIWLTINPNDIGNPLCCDCDDDDKDKSREEKRNYKAREYHVKRPSAKTFVRRPKTHHVKLT
jgi:hypothetical protein